VRSTNGWPASPGGSWHSGSVHAHELPVSCNWLVLELAIGTGRIALPRAGRGIAAEGIDASEAMVARLRAKPGGESIPVVIGDMAQVPASGPFRLVFNALFGLLSQAQQAECFRNVARVLDPAGVFVIECFVPDLARFDRASGSRHQR
jgi:SAM-dependent methyltransferase